MQNKRPNTVIPSSQLTKEMRVNSQFGAPLKSVMPKKTTGPLIKKSYMPKATKVKNPSRPNTSSMMAVNKSVAKSMGY